MDVAFLLRGFATLFAVVDPVSVVPVFLSMTVVNTSAELKRYARNAPLAATAVMLFFLLFGQAVFTLFDVTLTAFRIAGGVILLIIALDLLKATHTSVKVDPAETDEGSQKADISITPLGIPLLGGPGAISTVMVLAAERPGTSGTLHVAAIIVFIGLLSYAALRMSFLIQRALGVTGINVISRLLGLLLLAIAIQFLLEGLREAVPYISGG